LGSALLSFSAARPLPKLGAGNPAQRIRPVCFGGVFLWAIIARPRTRGSRYALRVGEIDVLVISDGCYRCQPRTPSLAKPTLATLSIDELVAMEACTRAGSRLLSHLRQLLGCREGLPLGW
jgi:hypothetical protein